MEWENKFTSIVRETESNLARVRDRLGPTSKTKAFSRSSVDYYGGSAGSGLEPVYSPGNIRSQVPRSSKKLGITWDAGTSPRSPVKSIGTTSGSSSSQASPALVNVLFERVEEQAELVTRLSETVIGMEKERKTQAEEIKRMKDEITRLSERLRERGVDMETERKLEQFKRDVYSQLEFVQSQTTRLSKSGGERSLGDSAAVNETRRIIQDETDSIQRELEHLKTRLGKVEIELHSTLGDSRDILRKQDRLDRALSSLSENQRSQSRSLSSVVDERQTDTYEIRQLKHLVDKVSHQYSELESELQSSMRPSAVSSRSSSVRNPQSHLIANGGIKSRRKGNKKKTKAATEDLVLSSSDSDQLSLTALDCSSPSDSELVSLALDTSQRGFTRDDSGKLSSTSLSSLDSDDLLGDLHH